MGINVTILPDCSTEPDKPHLSKANKDTIRWNATQQCTITLPGGYFKGHPDEFSFTFGAGTSDQYGLDPNAPTGSFEYQIDAEGCPSETPRYIIVDP